MGRLGKNGGESGDLYIKVNVLPHEKFRLEGSDLVTDLLLTPWEAVLGCEVEVQNIDSNIFISVPKGMVSGERLRVANSGYLDETHLGRGDLLLEIKIVVPKRPSDREIELYEELKKVSNFMPRGV